MAPVVALYWHWPPSLACDALPLSVPEGPDEQLHQPRQGASLPQRGVVGGRKRMKCVINLNRMKNAYLYGCDEIKLVHFDYITHNIK